MSLKMDKPQPKLELAGTFTSTVLSWFQGHGEQYPWRRSTSPYAILVAEIFLQRTQAKQVVPVYERFIARFPTPLALSEAKASEIEELLFPLGLQKKAGQLRHTAKDLVTLHDGQIPSEISELLKLKGIGQYTVNAILVFAFGCRLPVVDANIVRLFERVFGLKSSKKRPRTDHMVWEFAESILPRENVRQYTWGIIDFCNSICTTRRPDCAICPMRSFCNFQLKQ